LGQVAGARHEGRGVVEELATVGRGGERIAAVALVAVFGTGDGVTQVGASASARLDSVVVGGVGLEREKSTVLAFGNDTVGGPAGGELDSGRDEVGVNVVVDGVWATTDLARVTGTGHVALARDLDVLNVF
jgi:hypothetical protein